VVATPARSWDRAQTVEDPAHVAALIASRPQAGTQVLWTVVVVNLKRAARLLAGRATMPTLAAPTREEAA